MIVVTPKPAGVSKQTRNTLGALNYPSTPPLMRSPTILNVYYCEHFTCAKIQPNQSWQ